jgi:hypothetical protein
MCSCYLPWAVQCALFGAEPHPSDVRPVTKETRPPQKENSANPNTIICAAPHQLFSPHPPSPLPSHHGHPERARSERCQLVEYRRRYAHSLYVPCSSLEHARDRCDHEHGTSYERVPFMELTVLRFYSDPLVCKLCLWPCVFMN